MEEEQNLKKAKSYSNAALFSSIVLFSLLSLGIVFSFGYFGFVYDVLYIVFFLMPIVLSVFGLLKNKDNIKSVKIKCISAIVIVLTVFVLSILPAVVLSILRMSWNRLWLSVLGASLLVGFFLYSFISKVKIKDLQQTTEVPAELKTTEISIESKIKILGIVALVQFLIPSLFSGFWRVFSIEYAGAIIFHYVLPVLLITLRGFSILKFSTQKLKVSFGLLPLISVGFTLFFSIFFFLYIWSFLW